VSALSVALETFLCRLAYKWLFHLISVYQFTPNFGKVMKKTFFSGLCGMVAAALVIFAATGVNAQSRLETYAITNATIVTGSGATIDKGTVVVRDGLVAAVGAGLAAPADAIVVDGTGLTIYPGFFDAASNTGIPAAARPAGPPTPGTGAAVATGAVPQSNSSYPAGLQPETSALELIRPTDGSVETMRNAGITTALSVPREGIWMGHSALINTAGDNVAQMSLRAPVAQHVFYRTLPGGGYPASLMGTFSAIRQMLLDARRLQEIKRMYAANPRGIRRPDADRSLEALIPILNREMPVVIHANTEREIIRSLDLAKEFNLRLMIAGGIESWKVADRLKKQDVPVLLSLNFPKRTTAGSPEADPESLETLRGRADAPKCAAKLAAAGVKFAFQSGGMQNISDFLGNAAKAVENGLAKDAALRAMTLGSAEIFGVADRLGSLETGKIANMVVMRGDIFGKDRAITHVFVDGKIFEQKAPSPAPARPSGGAGGVGSPPSTTAAAPAGANLAGTWKINIDVPGQPLDGTMTLAQQGAKLTGTVVTPLGSSEIKNAEINGNSFSFTIGVTFGGATFDVDFSGTVNGNQISGTVNSPQGGAPFSGSKNP
jgi:imidazolonepropionase-like amidohydrolase